MHILFIGDIVSKLGRQIVIRLLPELKTEHNIDLVFANAENLAGGRGATEDTLYEMLTAGVDYFTSGNHIFYQEGWEELLSDPDFRLLRPANYPTDLPGQGAAVIETDHHKKILLINLAGLTSFNPQEHGLVNVFTKTDELLEQYQSNDLDAVMIDFHAEATSEKIALGLYLDGRISALVGTHTHVPTADARILSKGTAYVTDVGMTGPLNSVLGVKKEIIWNLLQYPTPQKFEWVKNGPAVFNSVLVKIKNRHQSLSIDRIDKTLFNNQ